MVNDTYQKYKSAKSISAQIQYLNKKKRIQFNDMNVNLAGEKLLEYNYINVITPFKHRFAKLDAKKEVVKIDGNHIYENDVEFSEYYNLFNNERNTYPIIIKNILNFEIHFKSIIAYYILNTYDIDDSRKLELFLDKLKLRFSFLESRYNGRRIYHMNGHIDEMKKIYLSMLMSIVFLIE